MITRILFAVSLASLSLLGASADLFPGDTSKVTLVFDHTLPNVPGKSVKVVLVEYPPGGSSPGHIHPDSAFIYARVLEGAIRSKVNDGPEKVYRAGDGFPELPGDHHSVSANASKSKPARLLAVFVVDTDEKNLTRPDHQEGSNHD